MIGRELEKERVRTPKINPDYYLSVENFGYKSLLHDINFKAYSGEILGIGGLVGSGRTELISCIYGTLKGYTGTLTLGGKPIGRSARQTIKNGFGIYGKTMILRSRQSPHISVRRRQCMRVTNAAQASCRSVICFGLRITTAFRPIICFVEAIGHKQEKMNSRSLGCSAEGSVVYRF